MRELQHNHGAIFEEFFECWQVIQLTFQREDRESQASNYLIWEPLSRQIFRKVPYQLVFTLLSFTVFGICQYGERGLLR
jgi:hypothetical protein